MAARPAREAVTRWNLAYAEQTAALFAAANAESGDPAPIARLATAYRAVASAWRVLAADLGVPLWARHAAAVAAEEFERRARVEDSRLSGGEG
ncbi:hypothetical protein JOF53_002917 [Crossiella equi]|uniref:SAV-6107-like HEPN domain-containing protein n=1 Tax=Crossiella equi TaxID=130796 RepID=A0ABS5ABU4_9PSEU|nr:hypothetical protein [Crossiella equi]MBP2474045.1 hypothetical protein [Crossiella equi]